MLINHILISCNICNSSCLWCVIVDLKKAFEVFDIDGDGSITKDEVARVLKNFNVSFQDEDLQRLMSRMDEDSKQYSSFNPGKDSKYDVMSESWEPGFSPLNRTFVDTWNGVVETLIELL